MFVFLALLIMSLLAVPAHAALDIVEDWEGDNPLSDWDEQGGCYNYSFQVVTDPCGGTNQVLKVTNIMGDTNSNCNNHWNADAGSCPSEPCFAKKHRAQLAPADKTNRFGPEEENWVGMSLFIDPTWPTSNIIDMQLAEMIPDPSDQMDWDIRFTNDGDMQLRSRDSQEGDPFVATTINLGAFPLGEWVNLVIHYIRADETTPSSGVAEFWVNGVKQLDKQNEQTSQSAEDIGRWKLGIYHGGGVPEARAGDTYIAYFDDVKQATGANQFDDVVPTKVAGQCQVQTSVSYGPAAEPCYTTQQPGTNGLIIRDPGDDLQATVENQTNKTILLDAGIYTDTNFKTNDGNFIAPHDCADVTLKPTNEDTNIQTSDDWTFAGLKFDCSSGTNNCFRIDGPVTGATLRNNHFIDAGKALTVRGAGDKQVVIQGNRFSGPGGNTRPRGLLGFKDDMGDVVVKENWIDLDPTNTNDNGNDAVTFQGVTSAGLVYTDNLHTGQAGIEQYMDLKRNTAPTTISFNTFIGPSSGHGNGNGERALAFTLGDNTNAQHPKGSNPTHSIHHNYCKDSWTQDETVNGTIGAWCFRVGTDRFFSAVVEFNVDDNDKNTHVWEVQNEVFDRFTFRHNTIFKSAVRYQNEACTANDAAFTLDNNVFHQTAIHDLCIAGEDEAAQDWTVTNNVFSQVNEGGIDAGNQDAGNSDDTIAFGSTADTAPDFTVLGGTHSQKGALPAPLVSSAEIGADCKLDVTMAPYNDLYNHGPISSADGTKVTPHYSGSADPTVTSTAVQGNVISFVLSSCPLSTDTVTFDATHGWCKDSANIGSTFAELSDDVTTPALLRARCLATTDEAVTNNVTGGGPSTFFVDVSCGVNGDGTTETCGANGPWNSIENAIVTDSCAGMVAGDTLEIKGGTYRETESLVPDVNCSGIIIENASGEAVVIDGTVDISGETWNAIGSGVFETTYDFGADEFPFTAWYDIGAGEVRLDLVQSNQTCDATLATDKMRYNPTTHAVCAHLSDGSSPAAADSFRIPQSDAAIRFQGDEADHITIQVNSGGGSFTIQRFSERGISTNHDKNIHITIDGLDIGWMMESCVAAASGPAQTAFTVQNSTIHHCGNHAIRSEGDNGNGFITGNTITEIQTEPFFEQCSGVGDGCLGTLWGDGAAIRLLNRAGESYTISDNTITHVGGGNTGRAYGIWLRKWNQNVTLDSNYIAHVSGLADKGYGIALTGDNAQEFQSGIVVKNNRVNDTDVAYGHVYSGGFITEAGETVNVFNNSFVDFTEAGIQLELSDNADDGGPISIRNNIIASYSGTPLHINIPTNNSGGWGDFKNNAIYCDACTTETLISFQGTTCMIGNCSANWTGSDIADNIFTDPAVSTSGDDPTLAISSGSNAEDVGITIGSVTVDFEDDSRPQNAGYDIGADEVLGGGGGGPSATIEQETAQFYGRYASEGQETIGSEEDIEAYTRGFFNLRFNIAANSGNVGETTIKLFARLNGGAWTAVDDDSSATVGVYIADHPGRTNRSTLTNQLSLDGRTYDSGVFVDGDTNATTIMPNEDQQFEIEYSLGISSAASPGDEIEFRIRKSGGTDIDTYTKTPKVTIFSGRHNAAGGSQQ